MNDKVYIIIMNLFFYIIMLILQILTPKMTRKNIYFGVRVPEEKINSLELKKIYRNYVLENIIVSILSITILSYWAYITDNIIVITTLPIFIYIGVLFIVYLRTNSKMKKLKKIKQWGKPREEVVVDIKFSKEKTKVGNVSSWWFLIPAGLALLNLVVGLIMIPNLPDKVPTNWDSQGNLIGYMSKTKFVWFMPLTQLVTAGILFFVYKIIGWSKQEISSKNPEESVKRNIIYRRVWSIYILVMSIVMNFLNHFHLLNLLSCFLYLCSIDSKLRYS